MGERDEIPDEVVDGFAKAMEVVVDLGRQERRMRELEMIGPDKVLYSTLTEGDWEKIGEIIQEHDLSEVSWEGFFLEPLAGTLEQIAKFTAIRESLDRKTDSRGKLSEPYTDEEEEYLGLEKPLGWADGRHCAGDMIVYAQVTDGGLKVMHESDLGWI